MKLLNTTILAFIAICILVSQTSCKKENDTFDAFPISIKSVDTLGGTKISWTKLESSDFLEYVLVRSSKDSITSFNELNNINGAFIIGRISNAKTSDFIDFSTNSFVNKLYYKVFVRLKNRILSSNNHVYNSDLSFLNIPVPSEIIQDEYNPNLVYFISSNTGQLLLYDLSKDSILARSAPTFSSSRTFFASNKGDNPEIIQINSGNRRMSFLDAKTLETKSVLDFTYNVYNATGSNDGYISIYAEEFGKQLQMLRLSDRRIVNTVSSNIDNFFFYGGSSMTKISNSNSVLLLENSSNPNVARLFYDAQGNFSERKLLGRIASNFSSFQPIRISSKGNFYLISGQVFTEPLNVSKPLNIFFQNYIDFAFKPDESKCYALRQNFNGNNSNSFEEYDLPSGKISKITSTKAIGRFVIYNNKAYIFGGSNNSSQQTILQKVQL